PRRNLRLSPGLRSLPRRPRRALGLWPLEEPTVPHPFPRLLRKRAGECTAVRGPNLERVSHRKAHSQTRTHAPSARCLSTQSSSGEFFSCTLSALWCSDGWSTELKLFLM